MHGLPALDIDKTDVERGMRPRRRWSCYPTTTMSKQDFGPHQSRGSRKSADGAQITTADLRAAPTFTRASKLPRGESATGSLEYRLETAIKQLSECARQADDEWLVEALAAVVADLERLWAHAAGIEFSGGESA